MANEDYWEWLSLVESDGPFLSKSALKSFYPSGLPKADSSVDDVNAVFVSEHSKWITEWTSLSGESYRVPRDRWVESVLRDLLEWGDYLKLTPGIEFAVTSPDGRVEINPFALLEVESVVHAMVLVVDKTEDLRSPGADGWAADAIDRMSVLLRSSSATIGIVTDGRWWALVSAAPDTTTASGVFDATWWRGEEKPNRDSFFALANVSSIALGAPEKRLELLFKESVASAEQITEALGDQVRRAVELVLQSMSDSHLRALSSNNPSPLPADARNVYEGAVTVLMRVVFLLFAEERGLFPEHELFRAAYSISGLRQKLSLVATETSEEALDHSAETWHRLLAVSQAVYGGASFEDIRMPAYGGSLFDPERFPWLYATDPQGRLLLRISDRVMLAVLDAVQIARVDGDARSLSFRDLDVEQIGYVYEGLLGYSAEYVDQLVIGLEGKSGYEPEITLAELEKIREETSNADEFVKKLLEHLKVTQEFSKPKTANQLSKALGATNPEVEAASKTRLRHALLGDEELLDRLLPFAPLIREDLRAFPYVVPAGGLVMTESQQRSNTGTHYTPRSLAEEVVLHALEPLVYSPGPLDTEDSTKWVLKSSTEILNLKVADIAVGSGAFLVAAARYLAARLIEARALEGLDIASEKDFERWAIREVVARCLYGADINGMAVEMCKLSLWLISMDPGKPFSFVDDRIFHGNSLLGVTSQDQLRQQHIAPTKSNIRTQKLVNFDVESELQRAAHLRRELTSGQVDDADRMRSTKAKKALLDESKRVTEKLRDVADGIIATGLKEGGKLGKSLDYEFDNLADILLLAYPSDGSVPDRESLDRLIDRDPKTLKFQTPDEIRPLHWILEVPDVFDSGGFDAIIGNPPFLGGKKISGAMGTKFRDWLINQIAGGKKGNVDLAAYFFLRAFSICSKDSMLGLIATNTIAQGDTREVGLDSLIQDGFVITRAVRSKSWPAASANLDYAAVWGTKSKVSEHIKFICDEERVSGITSLLEPLGRSSRKPTRLKQNSGFAFIGSYVLGKGFVVSPEQAESWIMADPKYRDVLSPYINGEDLNNNPTLSATRWVINFKERSELESQNYSLVWEHVLKNVYPERIKNDAKKYPRMVNEWWKFFNARPGLMAASENLDHVIALTRVSKAVMPVRVSNNQVFSDSLTVFATDDYSDYAFLSSFIHQSWAITYSSTLGATVRYTPSDVFDTIPRPKNSPEMALLGKELSEQRASIQLKRNMGLTTLYNLVNAPDINDDEDVIKVRRLHSDIDVSVMRAYGWSDLELQHGFYEHRQSVRFSISDQNRQEITNRLLEENEKQAALKSPQKLSKQVIQHLDEQNKPTGALF